MSAKFRLPPGSRVHLGEPSSEKTRISLIDYDLEQFQERELKDIEECFGFKDKPSVTWINVDGVHDVELIEKITRHFEVHPLVMEDIVNTTQRPKMDDYGNYLFIVFKMLEYDSAIKDIRVEQMSLIVGTNYLISFQEREGDIFNLIRDRIRHNKGRIRKMGADYLAYTLIDATVDHYFVVLEHLGEQLEDIEFRIMAEVPGDLSVDIHYFKREMLFLRKHIWPLREVISGMQRLETKLIQPATHVYLRDAYDHTIQVIDTIESYRDVLSGIFDIHLTGISSRTNEIMKVLTIISTIFMPLTFIAGIYGMNFKHMPELETRWGYFVILGFMVLVGVIMLFYFRRQKWF